MCIDCHQHSNIKPYLCLSKLSYLAAAAPARWRRPDTAPNGVLLSLLRATFSIRCSGGPQLGLLKPHARVAKLRGAGIGQLHSATSSSDGGVSYSGGGGVHVLSHWRRHEELSSPGRCVEFGTEGWTTRHLPEAPICLLKDG
jgi:hypothetical protein